MTESGSRGREMNLDFLQERRSRDSEWGVGEAGIRGYGFTPSHLSGNIRNKITPLVSEEVMMEAARDQYDD